MCEKLCAQLSVDYTHKNERSYIYICTNALGIYVPLKNRDPETKNGNENIDRPISSWNRLTVCVTCHFPREKKNLCSNESTLRKYTAD